MNAEKLFLGIDIGGTNIKACIFDAKGSMLSRASCSTPVFSPAAGFYERRPEDIRNITFEVIREAISKAPEGTAESIIAVGTTGHGKGLYLIHGDGGEALPAIASTDSRAADIVNGWYECGIGQKAAKLNMQTTLACQPPSLLYWLKKNDPASYSRIKYVLEAKDYLRYILTGALYTEYTDASGTALMNLHTKEYDRELFALYGIEEMFDCMPPLRRSTDACGTVTKEAAEQTGLKEGTVVSGGMFDIDACALAMGVVGPEPICVITGTWSINEYLSPEPLPEAAAVNHSLFCLPEFYLIEESSATSAGNLDAVLSEIMGDEHPDYRAIDAAVEETAPEDHDILFYPFMYGTNSASLRNAAWLNLRSGAGRGAVLRSVFEGVIFSHNYHINRLLKNRPSKPELIRAGGGGAVSAVWMQMLADVTGIKVEALSGSEPGAMGAAMAAAVCAGRFEDLASAADNMLRPGKVFVPDPARHAVYSKKFDKYISALKVLEQLKGII